MKSLFKITFVIFAFGYSLCIAQQSKITFEHFGLKDGLPSLTVPCLFQDRIGYLWFGTFHGIAKYDGYLFVSYTPIEGDSTSISNAYIRAICDDSYGNIWIGHSQGLDKFNNSTESFTHFILNNKFPLTDWCNHVLSLLEDSDSTLWIGTGRGLYKFNRETESFEWYTHNDSDSGSLSSNNINAIYEDKDKKLWFATGKGLNYYNKEKNSFVHYLYPAEKYKDYGNVDNPYWLLSILEDNVGTFWLGSSGGIIEFNRKTNEHVLYQHDEKDPESLADNIVLSISEDKEGYLWISTKEGVDIFDKKTKVFYHNKHDNKDPQSIGSNDVGQIITEKSGTIWISLYGAGGVAKYTPPNPQIKQYNDNNFLSGNIQIIYEDEKKTLWVGLQDGLLKFNSKKEIFEKILFNKEINHILEDQTGTLWANIWKEGIYKINKNDIANTFLDARKAKFPTSNTAICKSENGNFWIGNTVGDIFQFNPLSDESEIIAHYPTWIEAVFEDSKGILWIGTREMGIICYNINAKVFNYYSHIANDSLTISGNNVTQFCEDKNGDIWIIASQTINKFERLKNRFIHNIGKNNFPNDVYYIMEDGNRKLWFTTLAGAVIYDIDSNNFTTYRNLIGIGYKSKNGEILLNDFSSIIRFNPDSLRENPFIPPIVITDFRLFEKSHSFGKEIQVPYNENYISFEFAALSFINPEKNQYSYKMEGVDKDWINSGSRRYASYPNLDPGEYTFRVKGSNNDGVWNEAGTSVLIIISPPWWKTWWAYSSYALIFAFTLFGIRRYEMNRLKLKDKIKLDEAVLKEKEETDKMKSSFFANISHEFRTPLTLILGPAEKISSKTSDDVVKDANIIKRNSRRLLQLINQLLDLSKLESGKLKLEVSKGNIVSFVKGVALSFESLAESKDITLKLLPEKEFIEMYFDKEKMMKILTNILSNAFKFTSEEGKITVSIKENKLSSVISRESSTEKSLSTNNEIPKQVRDDNVVEIKIRDTGIGITQEEIPKLFDRFYQVDSSHTREYEGTGIGLALTKELVELHHGRIIVESEKGIFTEFTLQFPLGRDHLNDEEIIDEKADVILTPDKVGMKNLSLDSTVLINTRDSSSSVSSRTPQNDIEANGDKTIILVVEDNYDMRQYIRESLDGNYLIEEAVNGEQGVRKAEKIIPDLIISDMMMPKMDGNELVRILKNDEKTSHIPIILLTAKAGQENKLEGLEIGADDYLTKPFDIKELQVRIKNLISIRKKLQEKFSKIATQIPEINKQKLSSLDEKFMVRVGEVIDKHISEEEFDIEQFCSEIGMSRTQLHRKLKALTGKSASIYVRSFKLEKARKLIADQSGNISEVAYSLGFSSPAYFSKCFKEEFGYPPSDVKK